MTTLFREENQANGITQRIDIYTGHPNMFNVWLWEPEPGAQMMVEGSPEVYLFKDKDITKLYEFTKSSDTGNEFQLKFNQFYPKSSDMDCTKFSLSDLGKKFRIEIVAEHRKFFGLKLEYSKSRSYEINKEIFIELSKDLNDLYLGSITDKKKS